MVLALAGAVFEVSTIEGPVLKFVVALMAVSVINRTLLSGFVGETIESALIGAAGVLVVEAAGNAAYTGEPNILAITAAIAVLRKWLLGL